MVVEDDPVNMKLMLRMLARFGYEPLAARNGAEAVGLYACECPDCVLMDIQMPEMDGTEAADQIRGIEKNRSLPPSFIAALTANTHFADQQECHFRMNAFLNKPFKIQGIKELLQRAWEFRRNVPAGNLSGSQGGEAGSRGAG